MSGSGFSVCHDIFPPCKVREGGKALLWTSTMPVYCLILYLRKMRCSCQQRPYRWLADNAHLSRVLYLEHRVPRV